jgi:hypothetical protein
VVLTGNAETASFCREVADRIRERQVGDLWVCPTLAEFEERARFPAFLGSWWYTGSADRVSQEDLKAYNKLLKNPAVYGTAVLTGTDFTKYKSLTRGTKHSTKVHEVSTSFPGRQFLVNLVQRGVIARGSKIAPGVAESFIWRLGESYSKYEYYLDRLIAELPRGAKEVTSKNVTDTLKGVTGASFDDFLKYLLRPMTEKGAEIVRANKLFKSYKCMVDDGAAKTLRRLHNRALQYMEIRRLINEGYIPYALKDTYTVEKFAKNLGEQPEESEEDKEANKKKKAGVKFSRWDILQWGDTKFRREVDIASKVPIADWYIIALLSSKRCNSDEEAEFVFFDILTRSRTNSVEQIITGGKL